MGKGYEFDPDKKSLFEFSLDHYYFVLHNGVLYIYVKKKRLEDK